MAASMSLAKSVIFNLCKARVKANGPAYAKAFPNASLSPTLTYSTKISTLSFSTSASKHPWDGHDVHGESAYEDAKGRAKEGGREMKETAKEYAKGSRDMAKEGTKQAKEKVKSYMEDGREKAAETAERAKEGVKEGRDKATETAQSIGEKAKETVQGAWEAAKDTTNKIKETVMGSNNEEEEEEGGGGKGRGSTRGQVMDEDVVDIRTNKSGRTKFDE